MRHDGVIPLLNRRFNYRLQQKLNKKDFIFKKEWFSSNRLGKRQILNREKTKELTRKLNQYFQTLETLINEEAYLLAKFFRNEGTSWKPRIALT